MSVRTSALCGYNFIPLFLTLFYAVECSLLITHPNNPQDLIFKSTFSINEDVVGTIKGFSNVRRLNNGLFTLDL